MKDFESLTVIGVQYYCKVNPACFKCFRNLEKHQKVIKCNQLQYFNKGI